MNTGDTLYHVVEDLNHLLETYHLVYISGDETCLQVLISHKILKCKCSCSCFNKQFQVNINFTKLKNDLPMDIHTHTHTHTIVITNSEALLCLCLVGFEAGIGETVFLIIQKHSLQNYEKLEEMFPQYYIPITSHM